MWNSITKGLSKAVSEVADNTTIVAKTVASINAKKSISKKDIATLAGAGITIAGIASMVGVAEFVIEDIMNSDDEDTFTWKDDK